MTQDVEPSEAETAFTEWFVKNYPGPETIIHKPTWHAPKIFRAVKAALAAMPASPSEVEAAFRAGHEAGFDAADSSSRSQQSHVEDAWDEYRASQSPPITEAREENYLTRAADDLAAEAREAQGVADDVVKAAYEEGWRDRKRAEIGQLAPFTDEAWLRSKSFAALFTNGNAAS